MTATLRPWLPRAYAAALLLHAAFLVVLVALAFSATGTGMANAAPDTLLFDLLMAVPVLLAGIPSVVALLSWHMCRRKGVTPSPPHMSLTTVVAAVLLAASLAVVATA